MGGIDKSHVIKAIVRFIELYGSREKIVLGALTGIAVVLINGHTICALTFLLKSRYHKAKQKDLTNIWRDIWYLIIDEVSMISASFMADISTQIAQSKNWIPSTANLLFSSVNIIFFEDFGQLQLVWALSFFLHKLVSKI